MTYKVLFLGEPGVGKSQIIRNCFKGDFSDLYLPTIGRDIITKYIPELETDVYFIDFGGTGIYDFLEFDPVIEELDLVVLVCDQFTIRTSQFFSNLKIKLQNKGTNRLRFIILRNKIDTIPFLPQELETLTQYALIHKATFLPLSAKKTCNVDCFETFLYELLIASHHTSLTHYSKYESVSECK